LESKLHLAQPEDEEIKDLRDDLEVERKQTQRRKSLEEDFSSQMTL
jgi:hypothetical protein